MGPNPPQRKVRQRHVPSPEGRRGMARLGCFKSYATHSRSQGSTKKKGNDQRIPLLDVSGYDAMKIIEEQGRYSNSREGRIFPYNGRSIGTAFRRQCKDRSGYRAQRLEDAPAIYSPETSHLKPENSTQSIQRELSAKFPVGRFVGRFIGRSLGRKRGSPKQLLSCKD